MNRDLSNITPLLSVAGVWTPVSVMDPTTHNPVPLANVFYSQITLPDGKKGLVVNGWAYDGWSNTTHYTVNAAILEENANGTLSDATSKWLPNAVNNGSGSVIVADFNRDGKQDIFLAAHNESPFLPYSSTAYISNSSGGFTKVSLTDSVAAHGAAVFTYTGLPTVFLGSYAGDPNPYYQYLNGNFVETLGAGSAAPDGSIVAPVHGDSVAVADFNGDGIADIVYADCDYGPGYGDWQHNPKAIVVYKLSDAENNTGAPEAILTPYFNGKSAYSTISSLNGLGATHTYRVWVDDFNHDGRPDIVAGGSLWPEKYSMLQLLQNASTGGGTSFADQTDRLNRDYNVYTAEVDYSMQMVDLDNIGINSYLIAGGIAFSTSDNQFQNNYILLNDGTGQMHVYMHDQFQAIGDQVNAFLATQGIQSSAQPRFIEYQTANGNINLEAEIHTVFVNVPLQLNPTTDYTDNITVADRNSSMLMRTWAGNDTFHDTNANTTAHIDGGLGINTSIYSHNASTYQITHNPNGSSTVAGNGLTDTLVNIERLTFSDDKIALDLDGNAGTTAKILGAVFGAASVSNKQYVGIGLSCLDAGWTYENLMAVALDAAGAKTHAAVVNLLWTNLVGSAPTAAQAAPYVALLDNGTYSPGFLGVICAELDMNKTHINLVGLAQTGIEYS